MKKAAECCLAARQATELHANELVAASNFFVSVSKVIRASNAISPGRNLFATSLIG